MQWLPSIWPKSVIVAFIRARVNLHSNQELLRYDQSAWEINGHFRNFCQKLFDIENINCVLFMSITIMFNQISESSKFVLQLRTTAGAISRSDGLSIQSLQHSVRITFPIWMGLLEVLLDVNISERRVTKAIKHSIERIDWCAHLMLMFDRMMLFYAIHGTNQLTMWASNLFACHEHARHLDDSSLHDACEQHLVNRRKVGTRDIQTNRIDTNSRFPSKLRPMVHLIPLALWLAEIQNSSMGHGTVDDATLLHFEYQQFADHGHNKAID